MKNIGFRNVRVTGGFWRDRQDCNRTVTLYRVYDRFADTGRIRAFDFVWKPGMEQAPHFYWDSDVAKWMEAAAYVLSEHADPKLEQMVDALVDRIAEHQWEDGYFNLYFSQVSIGNRYTDRRFHELYCAGHLIEAAIAYHAATGKRKFLDCMEKYASHIEQVFLRDDSANFVTPGHEEIELALFRLYEYTGEMRWCRLGQFFLDRRGCNEKDKNPIFLTDALPYNQSHLPVRQQREAVGHAVRAVYLYSGMADCARLTGDEEMKTACEALFDNIVNRKMYVTGGIGSSASFEAFSEEYDLPNVTAYSESCAAIGLVLFARRMQKLHTPADAKFADVIERVLYNGALSPVSLDGKSFFYENPLEIPPKASKLPGVRYPSPMRVEVFECSCCPPNVARFLASVTDGIYSVSDDGGTVFVQQYMASDASFEVAGGTATLTQTTDYPEDGKVKIAYSGPAVKLAVRIPSWCHTYNGHTENGYAYFDVRNGDVLEFDFKMQVRFLRAHPRVSEDAGKCAVAYGPTVFCMEEADNGADLHRVRLCTERGARVGVHPTLGVPTLTIPAVRELPTEDLYSDDAPQHRVFDAVLIPYYAFANRGENEMTVWNTPQ